MRKVRHWGRLFERLANGPLPVRSSMGAIVTSNGESIHRHAPVPVPARVERREPIAASDDSSSSFRDHIPVLPNVEERKLFPHDGDTLEPAHTSRRLPKEDDTDAKPAKWSGHRSRRNRGRKPREKDFRA